MASAMGLSNPYTTFNLFQGIYVLGRILLERLLETDALPIELYTRLSYDPVDT